MASRCSTRTRRPFRSRTTPSRRSDGALAFVALTLLALASDCKKSEPPKGARLRALLEAEVKGETPRALAELAGAPSCETDPSPRSCLDRLARFFGGEQAIAPHHPVQADLGALAMSGAFESVFDEAGPFLDVIGGGRGDGNDAFRLATARRLREAVPTLPKLVQGEPAIRSYVGSIGRVIPGACRTYVLLGKGANVAELGADAPDGSPCVARDLARPRGPGKVGSSGLNRAALGAEALVVGVANAIRNGIPYMQHGADEARALLGEIDRGLAEVAVPLEPARSP